VKRTPIGTRASCCCAVRGFTIGSDGKEVLYTLAKGTVVMRFIGNRQEPEEFLSSDTGILFWDPGLSKSLDDLMVQLQGHMIANLCLSLESTAGGKSNPTR